MNIVFEPITQEHKNKVMDIFNYYAENSFAAYPETKLPDEFFNMFLEIANKYPVYAIKIEGLYKVVGFCLLRSYNPIPSFKETAEISYFIDKDYVGQEIGKKALDMLEKDAKKLGIRTILANISSKNTASIMFHQKNGFVERGRLAEIGRKFGEYFDIIWMQKILT